MDEEDRPSEKVRALRGLYERGLLGEYCTRLLASRPPLAVPDDDGTLAGRLHGLETMGEPTDASDETSPAGRRRRARREAIEQRLALEQLMA